MTLVRRPGAGLPGQTGVLAAMLVLFFLVPSTVFAQAPAMNRGLSKDEEAGRRIYLEGRSSSGEPLRARLRGDVPVSGTILPCVKCHRRSGMGVREGSKVVPPVTGAALYRPREFYGTTPALAGYLGQKIYPTYTDETLAECIVSGVDPNGRVMGPVMPRYDMDDGDLHLLITYLKSLSIGAPGVTDNVLRFATVVDTSVGPAKRKAMLDVLRRAFRDLNAGTRHESQRSRRYSYGTGNRYHAYRLLALETWELSGPEKTWDVQLEERYRREPVFAMVSGIAAGRWKPVHRFCERHEIPCVLPNTDLPDLAEDNYFTVYFSKGMALEAEAIARYLETDGKPEGDGPIIQVYTDGERETAAAGAFREAMRKRGAGKVRDVGIRNGDALTAEFWRNRFDADRASVIVLWVPDPDLTGLEGMGEPPSSPPAIYLSTGLGAGPETRIPRMVAGKVFLAHPFLLPSEERRQTDRTRIWLKARNFNGADVRLQVNTFFAANLVGRAVKAMFRFFSRDYFLEIVEHETESVPWPTVYPRVSLGPGQRFASKGCYILRYPERPGGAMTPSGDWIIP